MLPRISHVTSVSLRPPETTDTGRCPECATENDPSFAFCRNCTRALSAE